MTLAVAVATSLGSAVLASRRTLERERQNLARVVEVLTTASFPLQAEVLRKMSGLSGAQFAIQDRQGQLTDSTVPLDSGDAAELARLPQRENWTPDLPDDTVHLAGGQYLAARLPLRHGGPAGPSWLIVLYPVDAWPAVVRGVWSASLWVGGLAAALAALVSLTIARRIVGPIRALRRHSETLANGQFQRLAEPEQDDEVRDLTRSINRMSEQLEHYHDVVRRQERLKSLDQLAAGIVHEVRNSVTGARMAVDLHARVCRAEADGALAVAAQQLALVEEQLQRFVRAARPEQLELASVELGELVDESIGLLVPRFKHAGVNLQWQRPAEPHRATIDRAAMRQVLVNLLVNAIDAVAAAPPPARQVEVRLAQGAEAICLEVCDNGPGPPVELAEKLFEPLVTGRPTGTGLGLAVARDLVRAQGGEVSFRREADQTVFCLTLPISPQG